MQRTLKLNKMTSFFYFLSLKKQKMLKNPLHMKQKQFNFAIVLKMSLSLASFVTKAVKIQGKCKNLTPPPPVKLHKGSRLLIDNCVSRELRDHHWQGKKNSLLFKWVCQSFAITGFCYFYFYLDVYFFLLVRCLERWNSW